LVVKGYQGVPRGWFTPKKPTAYVKKSTCEQMPPKPKKNKSTNSNKIKKSMNKRAERVFVHGFLIFLNLLQAPIHRWCSTEVNAPAILMSRCTSQNLLRLPQPVSSTGTASTWSCTLLLFALPTLKPVKSTSWEPCSVAVVSP